MKHLIYYLLVFYALVCGLSILYFDGTGDPGDSITHYLFARYAPQHPALYFDHWAKPLFVLLASPFAQAGFTGMKVFNSLISLATIWLTYQTALALNMRRAGLSALILMFSPLYYILTFSGLTEYLFALFTIAGVYLCVRQRFLPAVLCFSFLPYIRSEGLIIIGVVVLFLLYQRRWRYLPWLLFGSAVYALAGYFVYKDLLWVFTKIPYATLSSVYGRGDLFHFVRELINVCGVPVYGLFWIGFLVLCVSFFRGRIQAAPHFLILGGFTAFFIAHSLFWYLGIFNSMGLKRVLIGIMPLIALIALQGFNQVLAWLPEHKTRLRTILSVLLIAYILVFPFTVNPSAIRWEKDMTLSPEQEVALKVSAFLKDTAPWPDPLIYNHRYLSLPLEIDYFDPEKCRQISRETIAAMKPGDLLVWDNLYGLFESGIPKAELDSLPELESLFVYSQLKFGREVIFSGYRKK
jgi:hypothetical protein